MDSSTPLAPPFSRFRQSRLITVTSDPVVHTIQTALPHCLAGGLVIGVGVCAGWWEARRPGRWTVQAVEWWLDHLVRPLLGSRSWPRRTLVIAANNISVCAVMTALGALGPAAWVGVAGVGFSLGIGLRLLLATTQTPVTDGPPLSGRQRIASWIGIALNMLEPPAILLAAGLALSQGALSPTIALAAAWGTFVKVVLPLLVVAAAGEALWMGARQSDVRLLL